MATPSDIDGGPRDPAPAFAVHSAGSRGRMSDAEGAQLCNDLVTDHLDPDGTNDPRIITMNVSRTGKRSWRCAGTATLQELAKPLPRTTRRFAVTLLSNSDGSIELRGT